ncbi:uncharacterized protein BCR38DRAFT_448326 [Pseudomassariella vexata]|uniref:Fe2OG dioxygenase domain-containing protein n=1 Tax=Pseudomassariella vexata TaxID=1141098 RepID=A0A1Y2DFY1_9PEZI|nr:uncharacterized protein BCR38DRAFT_448326 [Pseudomassariella vexata]ORY58181.1 hypothetical protein BCR38DRAFT_448326 [Pseudomassariella vexata]
MAGSTMASKCPVRSTGTNEFPVIDFSRYENDPHSVSSEIFDAASQWGFLVLKGHGIPKEDVDEMFCLSEQFFRQPQKVKQEKWLNMKGQGYDLKESVIGVHEACCFGNVADANLTSPNFSSWWTPERRKRIEQFRSKCQLLSNKIFEAIALAMGLSPSTFIEAHSPHKEPGNALRLIRYHPLAAPPDPKFPRLCEHTDWGTMTFLFATTPGLEVRTPGDKEWVVAPVVEDAIVVNIADGLALWSGKALKSTLHRLSWESVPFDRERYSMAYFINANADAPIKILQRASGTGEGMLRFVETPLSMSATFGDYQAVRVKMIEKHDTHITEDELRVDPKFLEMVKNIGVAHGTGLSVEEEKAKEEADGLLDAAQVA